MAPACNAGADDVKFGQRAGTSNRTFGKVLVRVPPRSLIGFVELNERAAGGGSIGRGRRLSLVKSRERSDTARLIKELRDRAGHLEVVVRGQSPE
jgi:hypothetical protein